MKIALFFLMVLINAYPACGLNVSISLEQMPMLQEPFDVNKSIRYNIDLQEQELSYSMLYDIQLEVGIDNSTNASEIFNKKLLLDSKKINRVFFDVDFRAFEFIPYNFSTWVFSDNTCNWSKAWYELSVIPRAGLNSGKTIYLVKSEGHPLFIKPSIGYLKSTFSKHEEDELNTYDFQVSVLHNFAGNLSLEVAPSSKGPWKNLGRKEFSDIGKPNAIRWENISLDFDFISSYYRFNCFKPSESFKGPTWDFGIIDKHALSTPKDKKDSIESLVSYLCAPARNDKERARVLYRWIAQNIDYDVNGLFSGNYGDLSPEGVLKSGKSICAGYASLFERLAEAAGLEATTITGFAKGYRYTPGMAFSESNHDWNAVKINGTWYLLDCTWGAGYIDGSRYNREFDEHYFLTPPEEFIYDHFPENPQWQLLENPLSKEEFEERPFLRSGFFDLGLGLCNQLNGTITASGMVDISLYSPQNVYLMAELEQNGHKLSGYKPSLKRTGEIYSIFVVLPTSGDYILKIFGRQGDEWGTYDWVMDYKIKSNK